MEHYSPDELAARGIRFGKNVAVHRSVQFFGNNFVFGSEVRIDCFCVLSSGEPVTLGNHVHLRAYRVLGFGMAEHVARLLRLKPQEKPAWA